VGSIQMNGKSDAVLIGFDVPDPRDPADLVRHSIDLCLTTEELPLDENRAAVGRDGAITLHYTRTNAAEVARLRMRFQGLPDGTRCEQDVYENRSYAGAGWASAGWRTRTAASGSGLAPPPPRWAWTAGCTRSTTCTSPTRRSSSRARR
jgi:hypothetical protein